MYINHKKFEEKEEKYLKVKPKVKSEEPIEDEGTRKNKVFLKGMLKRMEKDKYI